jgi:hypothetical protein
MTPNTPINKSEAFVLQLAQRSALSLWCYNNPIGKKGKELCDVLVVCEPHVIIISVKEIRLGEGDTEVDHNRWQRKAVDASIDQIDGAETWLQTANHVIRRDGSKGLPLPPLAERKTHRIAVAFGGRGEVIIKSGDFGKGFTHVMTEHSFLDVLTHLDTITDFTRYLLAKEELLKETTVIIEGNETNLLGYYLVNLKKFATVQTTTKDKNVLIIDNTIWAGLQNAPQFQNGKKADKESYVWDNLIEVLSDPNTKQLEGPEPELTDIEMALRVMAQEPRLERRALGKAVREFVQLAKAKKVKSRILTSNQQTIYVLVYFSATAEPKSRTSELGCRCLVARHKIGHGNKIVGIGLSDHIPGQGSTTDLIYIWKTEWSAEDDATAARMAADLNYFGNPVIQKRHEDEFPL